MGGGRDPINASGWSLWRRWEPFCTLPIVLCALHKSLHNLLWFVLCPESARVCDDLCGCIYSSPTNLCSAIAWAIKSSHLTIWTNQLFIHAVPSLDTAPRPIFPYSSRFFTRDLIWTISRKRYKYFLAFAPIKHQTSNYLFSSCAYKSMVPCAQCTPCKASVLVTSLVTLWDWTYDFGGVGHPLYQCATQSIIQTI